MRRFVNRRKASLVAVVVFSLSGGIALAADTKADVEALQAQLEEAQKLLDADKAVHEQTAEKKRLIDEKLAARKQRESEIADELKKLCEEQDKLKPGSLADCMAKLSN